MNLSFIVMRPVGGTTARVESSRGKLRSVSALSVAPATRRFQRRLLSIPAISSFSTSRVGSAKKFIRQPDSRALRCLRKYLLHTLQRSLSKIRIEFDRLDRCLLRRITSNRYLRVFSKWKSTRHRLSVSPPMQSDCLQRGYFTTSLPLYRRRRSFATKQSCGLHVDYSRTVSFLFSLDEENTSLRARKRCLRVLGDVHFLRMSNIPRSEISFVYGANRDTFRRSDTGETPRTPLGPLLNCTSRKQHLAWA